MAKDTAGGGGFIDPVFTIKNTFICFALTILFLFIVSWIAAVAALGEAVTGMLVSAVTYVCIGLCGFRSARHTGRGGLASGAVAGFIYVVLLYFTGSLILGALGFTYATALTALICIACGAIGGIVGINVRSGKRR